METPVNNTTPEPATLAEIINTYEAAERALKAVTVQQFHAMMVPVLEAHPSVKCAVWNQYTPYYCDGGPCSFRLNICDPCRDTALSAKYLDNCGFSWVTGGPVAGAADDGAALGEDDEISMFMSEDHCYVDGDRVEPNVTKADADAVEKALRSVPKALYKVMLDDGYEVYLDTRGVATREYTQ